MSYCRLLLTPRMTLLIVIGSLIYSVGLNQFIVPVGLYNGGFLGIAQLIRHFMESWFGISFGNTNIAGILYFIFYFEYTVAGGFRETFWEGISC